MKTFSDLAFLSASLSGLTEDFENTVMVQTLNMRRVDLRGQIASQFAMIIGEMNLIAETLVDLGIEPHD